MAACCAAVIPAMELEPGDATCRVLRQQDEELAPHEDNRIAAVAAMRTILKICIVLIF